MYKERDRMTRQRILGLMSIVGGLIGIVLVVFFATNEFNYPGTAAYRTYEVLNRLIALPLLLIACGWLGLAFVVPKGFGRVAAWVAFAASVLMAAGTAAEFWLFSDQPYGVWANGRMISFLTFSVASLILYISATIVGVRLWRAEAGSRFGAVIFIAAIPLYIAVVFTLNSNFLVPSVLALVAGWIVMRSPTISPIDVERPVSPML
jgi:hypothetical protein